MKQEKPLGRKAYGSIAHLPGSRTGPTDSTCHEGQRVICMEKARDKHDTITVTEKLDGSNVAIANINGGIVALGRAGYPADTSPFEMHHVFAKWAEARSELFGEMLSDGDVLHGEWLAQAHGTIYNLYHAPFVAFDLTKSGNRVRWSLAYEKCQQFDIVTPRIIHQGGPIHIDDVLPLIEYSGHGVASGEKVEGAVWRVERNGEFDFMAKWVRPDKVDGKYLPGVSDCEAIWNWKFNANT